MPTIEVHTKFGGMLFEFPDGEDLHEWAQSVEDEAGFTPKGLMQTAIAWKAVARSYKAADDAAELETILSPAEAVGTAERNADCV